MKKFTLLFLMIFAIAETHAQNYLINFLGSGASMNVDSVKVENLTQGTTLNISGGNILHLTGIVGIHNLNTREDNTLLIYPNPMKGNCTISFTSIEQSNTDIELFDITGKRILQMNEFLLEGNHTYNLSGISSGVYFLKIESERYSYIAKIVSISLSSADAEIKHNGTTPIINKQNSNSEKIISVLKNGKSIIDMQYNPNDLLKLTGKSGIYKTVFMLVASQTQAVTFNFVACTDANNNNYSVLQIGIQVWMAENLKTTKYNNGTAIPLVTDGTGWNLLSTPAYCWYNNDSSTYGSLYGALYNWYTINTGNLCPTGWHAPTNAEWTTLNNYLGGTSVAGGKLKETGASHWNSPNTGATNETGFTALPGGDRDYDGPFYGIGDGCNLWSSTVYDTTYAYYSTMSRTYSSLLSGTFLKTDGFSVRCVRD